MIVKLRTPGDTGAHYSVSLTKDEVNALYRNEAVVEFTVGDDAEFLITLTTADTRDTFRKEPKC